MISSVVALSVSVLVTVPKSQVATRPSLAPPALTGVTAGVVPAADQSPPLAVVVSAPEAEAESKLTKARSRASVSVTVKPGWVPSGTAMRTW